jgi:hypothetical protein
LKKTARPYVICSSWGSDLIFYGKLPSHDSRLRNFLSHVDVLLAERPEEERAARKLGYQKTFIAPVYTTIGSEEVSQNLIKPSARKLILVKGYQDNHGRALNALNAISSVTELLDGYEIVVVSASESVALEAERLKSELQISIKCLPRIPHSEIVNLLRESRIYMGLSISDGLSTMMIEAMQSGAFPIQSKNSGAPDFIQHGVSGFVIDPWNFDEVRSSLQNALTDDELVNNAVAINSGVINKKYNREVGLETLRDLYNGKI